MMNSKERVLAAASLGLPDRLPMDFHGNPWVLERLARELRAESHSDLLERLHSDIVDLRGYRRSCVSRACALLAGNPPCGQGKLLGLAAGAQCHCLRP